MYVVHACDGAGRLSSIPWVFWVLGWFGGQLSGTVTGAGTPPWPRHPLVRSCTALGQSGEQTHSGCARGAEVDTLGGTDLWAWQAPFPLDPLCPGTFNPSSWHLGRKWEWEWCHGPSPGSHQRRKLSLWWPGVLEGGTVARGSQVCADRRALRAAVPGRSPSSRSPSSHHAQHPLRSLRSGRSPVCCAVSGALPAVLTLHYAPKVTAARPHGAATALWWAWRFGCASCTVGAVSAAQ